MPGKIRRRPTPPEYVMRHVDGVPLTFLNEAGEQVKEKFSIDFKSYTGYGWLKLNDDIKDGEESFVNQEHVSCEVWARSITKITDSEGQALTDENGEQAKLTAAFFLGLLDEDREALRAAFQEEANPLKPSSAPGNSGSNPEASEG